MWRVWPARPSPQSAALTPAPQAVACSWPDLLRSGGCGDRDDRALSVFAERGAVGLDVEGRLCLGRPVDRRQPARQIRAGIERNEFAGGESDDLALSFVAERIDSPTRQRQPASAAASNAVRLNTQSVTVQAPAQRG